MISPFINEAIFLLFNYIVIRIHARRFDKNIPIGAGFHFWWGFATALAGTGLVWLSHWNWWFAGALLALRAWVYNPVLNYSRHPRKPLYYLSTNDKHNSFIDSIVYRWYKIGWTIALGGWLFLQYKIYSA